MINKGELTKTSYCLFEMSSLTMRCKIVIFVIFSIFIFTIDRVEAKLPTWVLIHTKSLSLNATILALPGAFSGSFDHATLENGFQSVIPSYGGPEKKWGIPYACHPIDSGNNLNGAIALVQRGNCSFLQKARIVQDAGASAMIVVSSKCQIASDSQSQSLSLSQSVIAVTVVTHPSPPPLSVPSPHFVPVQQ
jgi:PA domain